MRRHASAVLTLESAGTARLVFAIAAAGAQPSDETFTVTLDGRALDIDEIADVHGTRLHAVTVDAGTVEVAYDVTIDGEVPAATATELDAITYLRPSRYCESDALATLAAGEFPEATGLELLDQVSSWVGTRLAYVSGSSSPTDGAVATQLARQGVCRDYAHLVAGLLRARDVPARVVAVYAPGLLPMDFHAVAEALIDGRWWVVDATALAPRQTMLRIATGRDAADIAFLTTSGADVELLTMQVTAIADSLPRDQISDRVELR